MRVCFRQIIELEWTERHCRTKIGPAGVADDMLLKFAMNLRIEMRMRKPAKYEIG